MKAIVYQKYGSADQLKIQEVEKPQPGPQDVLIKILATSVNKADWFLLNGKPFPVRLMAGMFSPKNQILGADVAGVVEKVGDQVKQFKPGDEVFGDLSGAGFGGFAEYVIANEKLLVIKPAGSTFEEASTLGMAAVTALQGLRDKGKIGKGQKLLINGASGGVGSFAVQIAKFYGAEVTAVCSTSKIDLACRLGADHVIDYTKEDFTRSDTQYDLIFDVAGKRKLKDLTKVLKNGGRLVTAAFSMEAILQGPWISAFQGKKISSLLATTTQKDLQFLRNMVEDGKVKPVLDRTFTLDDVPAALELMGSGHSGGKIVITI